MLQVVSLFAITGGLAVDCVRQGHTEYLTQLVDGIAAVIEDELVAWINENGGWVMIRSSLFFIILNILNFRLD